MQTNSVDSNKVYVPRSRSIVGNVANNVLFGAVAGAAIGYGFNLKEDEFVGSALKEKSKEMHAYRVNNLKEKIVKLINEAPESASAKELPRVQKKLAYLEKQGAGNYSKGFAKYPSKLTSALTEHLQELFTANKEKNLAEKFGAEEAAEFKSLFQKAKLSKTLKSAKSLAIWCGAIGLAMGIAE